eukprot:CAMPEP_0182493226 /NCGR_PEP_ID=MMETSP1321-20130603/2215_1 /TAXON_ID=91990 /ORGANISM="Bolidomonas sp., Strain RCC1657" /LENGTH=85 /DNA_ID=CAMNT_0024695927 /DNA_START=286 /DNA_END=544 /DNA_ORIENTATION=-
MEDQGDVDVAAAPSVLAVFGEDLNFVFGLGDPVEADEEVGRAQDYQGDMEDRLLHTDRLFTFDSSPTRPDCLLQPVHESLRVQSV